MRPSIAVPITKPGVFDLVLLPAAMTKHLPPSIRSRLVRYLLLNRELTAIAEELGIHFDTVYKVEQKLFLFGTPGRPQRRAKGRPSRLTIRATKALISFGKEHPYASQEEMR